MIGWRARFGRIEAVRGDTFAYEFYRMVPQGVVLVHTSINMARVTKDELEQALGKYDREAERLAKEEVDVLNIGGSLVSSQKGVGSDKELSNRIENAFNIPTFCGLTAVVEALQALSIKEVVVATPYPEEANVWHKKFLEESGFIVANIKGTQFQRKTGHTVEIAKLPPYMSYRTAKEAFLEAPDADGIYISCSRWQTAENIKSLEKDLRVPVVTNSQASVWAGLKRLHIGEGNPGYGQLFETL